MSFSKYYHSELGFIREMARTFAREYPDTEGMFSERGGDPEVERLFEGSALLAARVRQHIDNEAPELVQEFCDLIMPQYIRSLPSCSIVEFTPEMEALRGGKEVAAGIELLSEPVEGTACRFRTTAPVHLAPVTLTDVNLGNPRTSTPVIRMRFHTTSPEGVFAPRGLRFFLHGDLEVTSTLWLWLMRHLSYIQVRTLDNQVGTVRLNSDCVVPVGLRDELPLLPWQHNQVPRGLRLLCEYFTLPEKLFFFDLKGLDLALPAASENFEVAFCFNRSIELSSKIGVENFRLNCVPVINLFSAKAQPIPCSAKAAEYLIKVADMPERHAEVFSVDSVVGKQKGTTLPATYVPFIGFEHSSRPSVRRPYYRTRRNISVTNDNLDVYVSIITPQNPATGVSDINDETLSIALTCTNGLLAGRLRAGEICRNSSKHDSSIDVPCTNIIDVSEPVLPPLGNEVFWRLIGELGVGHSSLRLTESLRSSLDIYNFHARTDNQKGRANRDRLEAIQSLEARTARRWVEGCFAIGLDVILRLNETRFASHGETFLFGCIIDEIVASRLTMNSFTELKVKFSESGLEYAWPPRPGYQALL